MVRPVKNIDISETGPQVRVVCHDHQTGSDVVAVAAVDGRVGAEGRRQDLQTALEKQNDPLALAILIADRPAVGSIVRIIGLLHIAADIGLVRADDLVDAAELIASYLGSESLLQLVSQYPCSLALNIKVAADGKHRLTLNITAAY